MPAPTIICSIVLVHKLTLMALFVAAGGVYFFFRGLQLLARRSSLARLKPSTIRDAEPGPIAVSGIASGPHTLAAPVTGQRCFVYQTTVWQQDRPGKNGEWKQAAQETLHLPFLLEDTTGQLLVEPLDAEFDLREDYSEEFGAAYSLAGPNAIPPRVSVFLARHGISLGRPARIEERTLEPAAPVLIAGTLSVNPGIRLRRGSPETGDLAPNIARRIDAPNSEVSRQAPEVIRLSGEQAPTSTENMTQQQKIAAALTRAGITKPEAWAAAGIPAPNSAPSDTRDRGQSSRVVSPSEAGTKSAVLEHHFDDEPQAQIQNTRTTPGTEADRIPPLVLMKGAPNSAFVISCRSQKDLAGPPLWRAIAFMLGGACLSALGIYVLLTNSHLH